MFKKYMYIRTSLQQYVTFLQKLQYQLTIPLTIIGAWIAVVKNQMESCVYNGMFKKTSCGDWLGNFEAINFKTSKLVIQKSL